MILTSIIVLAYNNLNDTTKPCVESVIKNTPEDSYELIVVDNGSSDNTPEFLRRLARDNNNVRLHLNSTNKGYAAGNNDGIKIARGEYLVLLNSDTLVTPGWLDSLLSPLKVSKNIALVGPVTNSCGNEQQIDLPTLGENNFESVSAGYVKNQRGQQFETFKLGFFFVAMPSWLVDRIGLLDEAFGIGMFEDDDYCLRAKKAGLKLLVVEDSFVYHKGSVSFSQLKSSEYQDLFSRNQSLFLTKHNASWALSDVASSYLRRFSHDIEMISDSEGSSHSALQRIQVRFSTLENLLAHIREREITGMPSGNTVTPNPHRSFRRKFKAGCKGLKSEFFNGSPASRRRFTRKVFHQLFKILRK